MFKALANLLRSFLYLLTGRTDKLRENLDRNPEVIKAKFRDILVKKSEKISQFMDAMSTLVAQDEKKKMEYEQILAKIEKNETLKKGAASLLKQRLAELVEQNPSITKEEAQKDPKYMEIMAKFNDISSTQGEQKNTLAMIEEAKALSGKRIKELEAQLRTLKADVEKIKTESAETVAEVITSQQESELNKMLAGLSQDDSASADLQSMREMRAQARSEAKVSRIAAGTENSAVEAELIAMASQGASSKELEDMIGIDDFFKESTEKKASTKRVNLPES